MAGNTYVTTGYSTYTDIPSLQSSSNHSPKKPADKYVAEPKMIERARTPTAGNTNYVGSPSKIELLKEYVHSPSMSTSPKGFESKNELEYENSSLPRYDGQDDRMGNFSSPNKYRPSSPVHYASEQARMVRTESLSRPNKHHSLNTGTEGARHVRSENFSSPNNYWQSAGPLVTRHPLTTSTNNINEDLNFLEESVSNSLQSGRKTRGGVLDDLSIRAQPTEPQRRYAKPVFMGKTTKAHYNG